MQPAVFIRLRPRGPWRYGPGDGGQDRVDTLFRSDRLYSAVTLAFRQLGLLDEWLDATAKASVPAVVFSSLFPFQGDTLFAPPPATLWPPPPSLVTTPSPVFLTKVRWNAARFVPLTLIESILMGQRILADQWIPDAASGCLLRRDRPSSSPYRTVARSGASVDRVTEASVHARAAACVEFEPGSGLWTVVRFSNEEASSVWASRVQAAFRLLADTGFGGRRTSGWGQTAEPEFQSGTWPSLILPKIARAGNGNGASANSEQPLSCWLLSLYSPSSTDVIDWREGSYGATVRGGHVESHSGPSAEKKRVRMITEGSVIKAPAELVGVAVNVAPDGFPHPVYRAGFALALVLPEIHAPVPTESEARAETGPEVAIAEEAEVLSPEEPITTESTVTEPPVEEFTEPMKDPEAAVRELPEEPVELGAETEAGKESVTPDEPANDSQETKEDENYEI